MGWFFAVVIGVLATAIPIAIVVSIARRVRRLAKQLGGSGGFAESAAAALRRAGADPQMIARLETLRSRTAGQHVIDLRAALPSPAIDEPALPTIELPRAARRHALPRSPRLRTGQPPLAPLGGLDRGDRFRLSEPPDISEPKGPAAFGGSWLAVVALLGAGVYYFLR